MIKINNELKLGIQSWSFRGLENGNQDISKALKECNIDSLEITQKHVNFQNEQEVDSVIKFYKNNEITLSSCGVCRFVSDKKSNRNIFKFAKKAGIKAISANIDEDALNICEKLCEEYDIKLAIHNHGKNHLYGTYERLEKGKKGRDRLVISTSDYSLLPKYNIFGASDRAVTMSRTPSPLTSPIERP